MADLDVTPARPGAARAALAEAPPVRRGPVIVFSVLAGFALTVLWSAPFVDRVIGHSVTSAIIGQEATEATFGGVLAGIVFAFASGLGGTFTACNIAAMGAVAPMLGEKSSMRSRFRRALAPLGWLAAGAAAVSAGYGVIAALFGTHMPQYSTAATSDGITPRHIQSMVVFGVIGLVLCYLGLAALGVVRDPLERASRRFPHARSLVMGVLIGAFLVGRPYGLYRQLFHDVADSGNPLYGAASFMVQSLGNIVVLAVLFLLLTVGFGERIHRWMTARPGRAAALTGAAFLVAGVFTVLYWDVRLLSRFDLIWYPVITWYQ